jgi:hypothetical protein
VSTLTGPPCWPYQSSRTGPSQERGGVAGEPSATLSSVTAAPCSRFLMAPPLPLSKRTDQPGVWSQVFCDHLAELRPDVYAGWDAEQLADRGHPRSPLRVC